MKVVRTILLMAFSLVFVFSAGMLIRQGLEYKRGEEAYEDADSIANLPDLDSISHTRDDTSASTSASAVGSVSDTQNDGLQNPPKPEDDPYMTALMQIDLGALRAVNDDVIGWIYITDTSISYPIIHYTDNDYYLRRTWQKVSNTAGTIFMECRNHSDFSDYNTILYGHRMRNETMFGKLKYYNDIEYWRAHPSVYIMTEDGVTRYDIFSAYEVKTTGETYKMQFLTDEDKQKYIDFCIKKSVIDTGTVPTVEDEILTLSTCSGNGYSTRWIVQAYKTQVLPASAENSES